jgi:S1-C subfamily serine protease
MACRRLALVFALTLTLALAGVGVGRAHAATTSPTEGVVVVTTNLALESARAAGTGIVLTRSGEVLTNNHVIRGATTIKVVVPQSHHTYRARVLGYDLVDDVALLKLQGASGLATATRGNSATLKVGQATRAVGNAHGRGTLVTTAGRVTGLNRSIAIRDVQGDVARLEGLIKTSARLVPGDSGGPLLDAAGRVIGINTAGSPSFVFQTPSDGYAIPINRALAVAGQIEAGRSSPSVHIGATAFVGLALADAPNGTAVTTVLPGSPAAKAGLERGDVITAFDARPVARVGDLRRLLLTKHPGDSVTLAYTDTLGNKTKATIVLASGPPQ